ncbi:MAG: hypothetical protein LBR66_01260 [Candidatus Symbiothrix sp.]|jgi:hypothetical protein|nr:hypothetical protein [Candidatus Symbiothrix sp.]
MNASLNKYGMALLLALTGVPASFAQSEIIATSDEYTIENCDLSPATIDVCINDTLFCEEDDIELFVPTAPHFFVTDDNKIFYQPQSNNSSETINYTVSCREKSASSTLTVHVTDPEEAFVDDVWYFGNRADGNIGSPGLRFDKDGAGNYIPKDASGIALVNTEENCLVVSSPYCNGQLIFYMQHNQIFNNQHEPMSNGRILGHQSTADGLAAVYMGSNRYLIFTVTNEYGQSGTTQRGLYAYIIDMNEDNGKGQVIGAIIIEPETPAMSESLELIPVTGTSNQYWLVYAHNKEAESPLGRGRWLYSRLVTIQTMPSGLPSPIIGSIVSKKNTTFQKNPQNKVYQIVASAQGDCLAVTEGAYGYVAMFDFDPTTGYFGTSLPRRKYLSRRAYSAVFSPDGNSLYISDYEYSNPRIYQFDRWATCRPVSHTNGNYCQFNEMWYIEYGIPEQTRSRKGGGMKLGPDGNIYVLLSYSNYIGKIINPNDRSTHLASRYNARAIRLSVQIGNAIEFSTGITRPDVPYCNRNQTPIAIPDFYESCAAAGDTISVNVLRNDYDLDQNKIFLTADAFFINPANDMLADIVVDPVDSLVSLIIHPDADLGEKHTFYINYNIHDDGDIASKCSSSILTITTLDCSLPPQPPDNDCDTLCAGDLIVFADPTIVAHGIVGLQGNWEIETVAKSELFVPLSLPHSIVTADDGKKVRYTVRHGFRQWSSPNTITLVVAATCP